MEPQPADHLGNVSVLPNAPLAVVPEPPMRTKESIVPEITITVREIDPQSTFYSCEVTVSNVDDGDFSVGEVRPRLPKGVQHRESVDSGEVELVRRHKDISEATTTILTDAILLSDRDLAIYNARQMREEVRKALRPRTLFEAYFYLMLGRTPAWLKAARERHFKIEVTCADEVDRALKRFPLDENPSARRLVEFNLERLRRIEKEEDFDCSKCRELVLKKGQQHKSVHVIRAKRGRFSPNSYALSFDIPLRRGEYALSRVEYQMLTVPTGHLWTTLVAMLAAGVGALIDNFNPGLVSQPVQTVATNGASPATAPGATTFAIERNVDAVKAITDAFNAGSVEMLGAALTAAVVYNIFDMTSFKDRLPGSRTWRTALFIGFICGFLNTRILQALSSLIG